MSLVLLAACLGCSAAAAPSPWRATLKRIAAARDELAVRVADSHRALRARLETEDPGLLHRLDPAPPAPLPAGYGVLPELRPDGPEGVPGDPVEKRYDLPGLQAWVLAERAAADGLSVRISSGAGDIAALVEEQLLRDENLRRLDEHVRYHELWQPEGEGSPRRHDLIEAYRLWRSTPADAAASAAASAAGRTLELEATRFSSVPWHRVESSGDGLSLRVRFQTDIEDSVFLSSLAATVERFWSRSAAMQDAGLRVEVLWDRVPPSTLYPEGAPPRGSPIDPSRHLARFSPGYVLTTGAAVLHLLGGRAIVLGPDPTTGRILSHELAHVLGFADGYFRVFEGSPESADGLVITELTPFPCGLMADPGGGRVTPAMVRRLLEAYRRPY
jgi:hypothetical protein